MGMRQAKNTYGGITSLAYVMQWHLHIYAVILINTFGNMHQPFIPAIITFDNLFILICIYLFFLLNVHDIDVYFQVMFPSTLIGTGEKWTMMKTISVTEYLNYETGIVVQPLDVFCILYLS